MRNEFMATAGLAFLLACTGGVAHAETVTYRAALSGANEIPANDSGANGEAVAVYDTQTRMLEWTVSYSDTSGPLIGAHFHGPATESANAGVLVPMTVTESPIEGSAELSEEQAEFLEGGSIYVNLHTERFPGGELRGNLVAE